MFDLRHEDLAVLEQTLLRSGSSPNICDSEGQLAKLMASQAVLNSKRREMLAHQYPEAWFSWHLEREGTCWDWWIQKSQGKWYGICFFLPKRMCCIFSWVDIWFFHSGGVDWTPFAHQVLAVLVVEGQSSKQSHVLRARTMFHPPRSCL